MCFGFRSPPEEGRCLRRGSGMSELGLKGERTVGFNRRVWERGGVKWLSGYHRLGTLNVSHLGAGPAEK